MDQLDRALRAYCEKNQIFGVMRITRADRILYEASFGFADREAKRPFTKDSAFSFYSISKPFCAIGFLLLAERGLISLEDHPGKAIPEAAAFCSDVTFRQMLCHTSGLPDFVLDGVIPQDQAAKTPEALREQIAHLADFPSVFAPGKGARYSNINFLLTAVAIENITGMAYGDYMAKEVFAPLGMKGALVDREGLFVPHRVTGYVLADGAPVPTSPNYDWVLGAGDIVGTVEDVYALHTALRDRRLLKPETWEQVLTPSPLNQMGLGCTVRPFHGKPHIRHNGGSRGFRTLHMQFPEDDLGVIFLSNSGYGDARRDLADRIYAYLYKEAPACADDTPMDTGYAL